MHISLCKLNYETHSILLEQPEQQFISASNTVLHRESISKSNLEELTRSLRTITGWSNLDFNKDRVMEIGYATALGGSKGARDLLNKSFSGNRVIVFEGANLREDVVFCRVVHGRWVRGDSTKPLAYVVLIDFTDFHQRTGDTEARATLDVGWAVLHEIWHVVEDSEDLQNDSDDCDSFNPRYMGFNSGLALN